MKTALVRLNLAASLALMFAGVSGAQPADATLLTPPLEPRTFEVPKKFMQGGGVLTVSLPRGWAITEDKADSYKLDARIKVTDPKTKRMESVWFWVWVGMADDEQAAQRFLNSRPPSDEQEAGSGEETVGSWRARWSDRLELMRTFQRHNYHWYYARGKQTLHIEFHTPLFCFDQVRPTLDAVARSIDFQPAGAAAAPAAAKQAKAAAPVPPAPPKPITPAPAPAASVEPSGFAKQALAAYNNKQFAEALKLAEQGLKADARDEAALVEKGKALRELGRVPEAIAFFEQSLVQFPNSAKLHFNLGYSFSSKLQQHQKAAEHYEAAIRLDPTHRTAHNNLGSVWLNLEQPVRAEAVLKKAVELDPKYVMARRNLGRAYLKNGKAALAVAEFEECLRLQADDTSSQKYLQEAKAALAKSKPTSID